MLCLRTFSIWDVCLGTFFCLVALCTCSFNYGTVHMLWTTYTTFAPSQWKGRTLVSLRYLIFSVCLFRFVFSFVSISFPSRKSQSGFALFCFQAIQAAHSTQYHRKKTTWKLWAVLQKALIYYQSQVINCNIWWDYPFMSRSSIAGTLPQGIIHM